MTKRRAIASADKCKPNPDWRYSPPKAVDDIGGCEIDASQLSLVTEQYRLAGLAIVAPLPPRGRK